MFYSILFSGEYICCPCLTSRLLFYDIISAHYTDTFMQTQWVYHESLESPLVSIDEVSCLTFMYRGTGNIGNLTVESSSSEEVFFHSNMITSDFVPGMVSLLVLSKSFFSSLFTIFYFLKNPYHTQFPHPISPIILPISKSTNKLKLPLYLNIIKS